MTHEIRAAEPADQHVLSELHRRSSWVWKEDREALTAHPEVLGVALDAIADRRVRVAVAADGEVLGFSIVNEGAGGIRVLDDLFVDPAHFRQGVGRALIQDAVARAVATGHRSMTVVAHPRTFAFYESVGFVPGEAATTRFGPAVTMRRELGRRTQ
ncbi:MAG: GNAT family N-acetyltransferase [Propionibacteriaceae bacterium]